METVRVAGRDVVAEAGEEEGVYPAEFDLERLRAYRERKLWGNAFRKPGRYGSLTVAEVEPSFVRAKVRG